MANTIDGSGLNRVTRSTTAERAERGERTERNEGRQDVQAARGSDSVDITSSAVVLQTAEQTARETPEVNQDRVESIRNAIESGEYEVDALVVADKLLSFEALLR